MAYLPREAKTQTGPDGPQARIKSAPGETRGNAGRRHPHAGAQKGCFGPTGESGHHGQQIERRQNRVQGSGRSGISTERFAVGRNCAGWLEAERHGASEVQFKLSDNNGAEVGSADLKVVSPAVGPDNDSNPRNKSVGGVSTVALRRTVIDRMMKEQGWVVNDYQKEVGGKKVYVVVAQSPGGNGPQSRIFYFMEAEGRVYSLATSAPASASEKIARESEKVLNSLNRISRPVEAAAAATLR